MKTHVLIFVFLLVSTVVWGQPGDPGGNPDVPITGIELLIALGGALGIRKLIHERRNRKS